jgi:hypothetical protein
MFNGVGNSRHFQLFLCGDFRCQFEPSRFASSLNRQSQRDHLHGQDLENWVNGSRWVGKGKRRRRSAFTNPLCPPLLFATIF